MATTRPTGVTLLGIAFILLGLLSLFWSLLVFGFGAATVSPRTPAMWAYRLLPAKMLSINVPSTSRTPGAFGLL